MADTAKGKATEMTETAKGKAAEMTGTAKEAAGELGFPSTKDFSREFQAFYEVSPTDFQRRQDALRNRRLE